jgi:hypothetical protein
MSTDLRKQFIFAGTAAVTCIFLGCETPDASTAATQPTTYYKAVAIYSDPPGAYVYQMGGDYCGQTEENSPVHRLLHQTNTKSWYGGWVLKKRGYKPTTYQFSTTLEYNTSEEADLHEEKVVVVLDSE